MVRRYLATFYPRDKKSPQPGGRLRAGNETRGDRDKASRRHISLWGRSLDRGPVGEDLTGKTWRGAATGEDGQQANARLGGAICSFVFHDRGSDMGSVWFKFFCGSGFLDKRWIRITLKTSNMPSKLIVLTKALLRDRRIREGIPV